MRYSCLVLLILGALTQAAPAQAPLMGLPPAENTGQPLAPTDVEAIFQRLAQQDAEIERLRAEMTARTAPPASPELAAFEQPAIAQPGAQRKPADGWIDVSSEKWTVKLGGHVQLDYINWATASRSWPLSMPFRRRKCASAIR